MGSAKVIVKVQDRSAIVPAQDGVYGGIVLRSWKGPVNKPILITKVSEFLDVFGTPRTDKHEYYSALTYLNESNKLWCVRAAADNAKYGAALVRFKINPLPETLPDIHWNPDPIVKPLTGLTQDELDAYEFPLYERNREFGPTVGSVVESLQNTLLFQVSSYAGVEVNDRIVFGDPVDNDTPAYTITKKYEQEVSYDEITLASNMTGKKGDEIVWVDSDSNENSYDPKVYLVRDVDSSTNILVNNSDPVHNDDNVRVKGTSDKIAVNDKNIYKEIHLMLEVDKYITVTKGELFRKITHSKWEERDSFLVTGINQGDWNNHITIGIAESKNYPNNGFVILVYYDGVLVEDWEVTKTDFIDEFGNQLYLEDKINGKSKYITVIDNKNTEERPLYTNYSVWRKDPIDIFVPKTTLAEDVVKGDTEIKLTDASAFVLGDRIKFGTYDEEYKVISISGNIINIDRQFIEEKVAVGSDVLKFDNTVNVPEENIENGIKYYPIQKLQKVFYNYHIPYHPFIIDGEVGTLLDAGTNMLNGGFDGDACTLKELVTALDKLGNPESTPVTLLMDGGFTYPAYAQAMVKVAEAQDQTHCYLSVDPNAEEDIDYKNAVVNYVASLNLDTEKASVFSSWLKIFDEYNGKYVWVSPEAFAAASQSYTHRNYYMWYPAAGWLRGKLKALDSLIKPDEGTRDFFVDHKINPIKYVKGSGFLIWGNRTMYTKPSPLDDRSVAMLLIVIKQGLKRFLEFETFEINDQQTWSIAEQAIISFLQDIQSKRGLEEYRVAISSIITDQDIDNNRMPVFIGIKPTRSIKEIPVTLAIYNYGSTIKVQL